VSGWLDSIGEWAGNVTGFTDVVNDWNRAFSTNDNVFSQMLQFETGVANSYMKKSYDGPGELVTKVGDAAQATAGVLGRAATAPIALSHPEWGQGLGLSDQQYHDKVVGSIFDLDAKTTPGQIISSGLQRGFTSLPGASNQNVLNVNPYDDKQRKAFYEGGETSLTSPGTWANAPGKLASGSFDLFSSTALDPTNLAGPTFKLAKSAAWGEKVVTAAPEGLLAKAGMTSTSPDKLMSLVENGGMQSLRDFHRENVGNPLAFLNHAVVKNADPMEHQALASLFANTAPENFDDVIRLGYRAGTDQEIADAALRLKQSFVNKPGEMSYLVDRMKDGVAERTWAAANGHGILLDDDLLAKQQALLTDFLGDAATPAGSAYRNIVDRIATPGDAPWMTKTPARGPVGAAQNTRALARTNATVGKTRTVEKAFDDSRFTEPDVTVYQPTPQHPAVAIVDRTKNMVKRTGEFFTQLRPSGIVNVNDGDSHLEILAAIRQAEKYTEGRMTTLTAEQAAAGAPTEAQHWANAYISADSEAGRGAVATAINDRIFQLQATRYGLTEDAAKKVLEELKRNEDMVRTQLKKTDNQFTSFVDQRTGEVTVSHDPLLARENVDNIRFLWDQRHVDKALRRYAPEQWNLLTADRGLIGEAANTAAAKVTNTIGKLGDTVVPMADTVNDAFKMSALLRMGYMQRNLGEAYLSMAARGHLLSVAMNAFGESPEMAKNWVLNRHTGLAEARDRWALRFNKRADLPSLRYNEQVANAEANHLNYMNDWLLERLGNLKLDPEVLSERSLKQVARVRAEQTLTHHFHVTADGLPEVSGDFLATTDSHVQATHAMDDLYDYFSPHEDSLGSVEALANHVASLADGGSKRLEYQLSTGGWAPMSAATAKRFLRERTTDNGFVSKPGDMTLHVRARDTGKVPQIITVPAYGKHVDFSDLRKVPQGVDVNDRAALAQWARENGVGKITVKDPEWGKTTLLLRDTTDYAGGEGFKPIARRNADSILNNAEDHAGQSVLPKAKGSAENRAMRAKYRQAMRESATPIKSKVVGLADPVDREYTPKVLDAMMQKDLIGAMRDLAERKAQAAANIDHARSMRIDREQQVTRLGKKRVLGTGPGGAFEGDRGAVMFKKTSASDTNDRLVTDGTKIADIVSAPVTTVVQPNQARYFEGWANMLNNKFRGATQMDPIVKQFLDGSDAFDVEGWANLTKAGRDHMLKMGWHGDDVEDSIAKLKSATNLYIPEGPIRDAFRNGEPITEDMLRAEAKRTGHTPEMRAELAPMSAEYKDKVVYPGTMVSRAARKMLHYLGALPEDTFARHPLYRTVYQKQFTSMSREAAARKGENLTLDEANRLKARASEYARQEVTKTLFTVTRRSDAATSLRFMSPFYAAWDNQIRRWTGFAIHNPDSMSQLASKIALAGNNMHIINGNGDPISLTEAMNTDNLQDAQWVTPLPNVSGLGGRVKISMSSLDIIASGQPGPGLGPWAALPMYELMKDSPTLQDQYKWAFPAGVPENELELFLPAAARKLQQTNEGTRSFASAANLIMQTELLRWQNGERKDKPTVQEVKDKATKFALLKAATNLFAPFSVQYGSETDFYKQALRDLQDVHRTDPNGQQVADQEFLAKYPEAFDILPSLSRNNAKAMSTSAAVDNMKRYKSLGASATAADDPGLFGFVSNYGLQYNKADFSSAAYSWQFSNRGDMPNSYRQAMTPEEIHNQALTDKGWVEFSKTLDSVEGLMVQRGIDPTSKQGVQVLANVRKNYAQANRFIQNPDGTQSDNPWFLDYNSSDKTRYDRRASFFNEVLSDQTFMKDHGNDPLIQNIGRYLQTRATVAQALLMAKDQGGSASLKAKTNLAIASYWAQQVQSLKNGNIEFASWLNRYFVNDSVVL